MGTIPHHQPPDPGQIRAALTDIGVATTPAHDHLIAAVCGLGLGADLRSLLRTAALADAARATTLTEERAGLPPWMCIGLYAEWWRGGWWICYRHPGLACAGSAAWRTPRRLAVAAKAHLAEAHTPGEPASVRAACDTWGR